MMQSVAGWVRRVERWLLHVWVVSAKGDVVMMNGEGQPSSFGWGLSPGSITEPVHPELHELPPWWDGCGGVSIGCRHLSLAEYWRLF